MLWSDYHALAVMRSRIYHLRRFLARFDEFPYANLQMLLPIFKIKIFTLCHLSFQCQELWLGKAHIPRISMAEGLPKIVATLLSIRDGKRVSLTFSSPYHCRRAAHAHDELYVFTVSYQRKELSELIMR